MLLLSPFAKQLFTYPIPLRSGFVLFIVFVFHQIIRTNSAAHIRRSTFALHYGFSSEIRNGSFAFLYIFAHAVQHLNGVSFVPWSSQHMRTVASVVGVSMASIYISVGTYCLGACLRCGCCIREHNCALPFAIAFAQRSFRATVFASNTVYVWKRLTLSFRIENCACVRLSHSSGYEHTSFWIPPHNRNRIPPASSSSPNSPAKHALRLSSSRATFNRVHPINHYSGVNLTLMFQCAIIAQPDGRAMFFKIIQIRISAKTHHPKSVYIHPQQHSSTANNANHRIRLRIYNSIGWDTIRIGDRGLARVLAPNLEFKVRVD